MIGAEDADYYAFVPVTLPAATITINTQPQSVTVPQGYTATFTVAATTTSQYGISYQWKRNGTAIAGANSTSYSTGLLALSDTGTQFAVDINSPGAPSVTSQTATLTVIKDTTPPTVVSAGSLLTFAGGTEIGVIFDKPMTGSSLTAAANFTLDNGATVSAARYVTNSSGFTTFLPDGTRVPDRQQGAILTVSALNPATSYHVTVKNVSDYLTNVLTSQTVPVVQAPFTWVGMGDVATNTANPNGVENDALAVGTNSFNLVNGGNAFWTTEDDITMVYEKITGDFDKTTQVEWHDPSSNWARSGISAREDVNPTNAIGPTAPRYQMVISDPETKFNGQGANDAYETNRRLNEGDATTANAAGGTPTYPTSFVRLKRVDETISMFYSYNGQWWRPLGTTDFSTNNSAITTAPLAPALYVGPTLGVENNNILGQGGVQDQTGAFATRIRNYGNMVQKPLGSATYAVGLNFAADEACARLSPSDIAGVDAVAQAHWNNIFGNAPVGVTGIVADKAGAPVATAVTVSVAGSGNTWASQGPRGEEDGALMTGNDAVLMTGYLDTGNATTTQVTISGIPTDLTSAGYDLIVYALGGISARGGGYRVADASANTIQGYFAAQSPVNPTSLIQAIGPAVAPNAVTNWPVGNFIVFTNLKASSIVVEGTTDLGFAFGGTPRAPINAVQMVAPTGLIASITRPTISIAKSGNAWIITYTGHLYSSATVTGTFTLVSGATSPYPVPTGAAKMQFYRAGP